MSTLVIPEATRRRLLLLLNLLGNWSKDKITSVEISELTGWSGNTIRHDLWLIGNSVHGVKNGYCKADLYAAINRALGLEELVQNVCIAGLGRLGAALLDEDFFEGSGFVIKAGFDSNVNRVEILRSSFPLYPAADMNRIIRQEKITLAVLTVSDKDAKSMCERLVTAGIKGIVNMTRTVLKVPDGVKVENVSVLTALKMISN